VKDDHTDRSENPEDIAFAQAMRDRRRFLRTAALIGACLVLAVLYCLALDLVVLSNSVMDPLFLTCDHRILDARSASYGLYVHWDSTDIVHPQLMLNDSIPVPESRESATTFPLGDLVKLQVVLPHGVESGLHTGDLVLTREQSRPKNPETAQIPISLDINGSLLSNFHFSVLLCSALLLISILFYLGLTLATPRPFGKLLFADPLRPDAPYRSARLKMRKIAWLCPWKRNVLPLKYIWNRNKIRPRMAVVGYLLFLTRSGDPQLVIVSKHSGDFQRISMSDWQRPRLDPKAGHQIGRRDTMRQDRAYIYKSHKLDSIVKFRFDHRLY